MKAITILQPYASLIVAGQKKFETRAWDTPYRGRIAIHSGKSIPFERGTDFYARAEKLLGRKMDTLPKGAIIATAILAECYQVTSNDRSEMWLESKPPMNADGTPKRDANGHRIPWEELPMPTGDEIAFGHYGTGMFAWKLTDIQPLPKPLPFRGNQRIWEVPDAVIESAMKGVL